MAHEAMLTDEPLRSPRLGDIGLRPVVLHYHGLGLNAMLQR